MKILSVSLFFLLLMNSLFAQKTEGTIIYKETNHLRASLEASDDFSEVLKSVLPKEISFNRILIFHSTASLYLNLEKEEVGYDDKNGFQVPEYSYFCDIKQKMFIKQVVSFGKKFIIKGSNVSKWKISAESKDILGYTCRKATTTTEEGNLMEVWFTSMIPISVGPDRFNGLPGAVLSVSDGYYTIIATEIDLKPVDQTKVVPASKGKEVSATEFKKMVEEKLKEMAKYR